MILKKKCNLIYKMIRRRLSCLIMKSRVSKVHRRNPEARRLFGHRILGLGIGDGIDTRLLKSRPDVRLTPLS